MKLAYSLQSFVLLVLLVGAVLGIVITWQPWVAVSSEKVAWSPPKDEVPRETKDGIRQILLEGELEAHVYFSGPVILRDKRIGEVIDRFGGEDIYYCRLLDDETVETFAKGGVRTIWRRQYPEWGWGAFSRPLAWVAILLGAILLSRLGAWWRSTSRQKRMTAPKNESTASLGGERLE
jgi:hypothetical protein